MGAYSDPRYLASLIEFGQPLQLPASGAGLLVQSIPGSNRHDARGAYPLMSCPRWSEIEADLNELDLPIVSLVGVPDPLTAPPTVLNRAFPDLCRPYKDHFVARMRGRYEGPWPEGHRRNLRRASSQIEVERVPNALDAADDWMRLYEELCTRKDIKDLATFSEHAFRVQFAIPGMSLYRAILKGEVCGMACWLKEADRAYYHLGASTSAGLGHGAMFALFDRALQDLAKEGIERVLLGAGAGIFGSVDDGLTRFKAGWANESVQAYLCGKIFDREAYAELSNWHETPFFPAYRCPELVAAPA